MDGTVYRERIGASWRDVEIVGRHRGGRYILRETGRPLPGLILAELDCVRICGPTFEPSEKIVNEGMRRWWATRKRPPMTCQQLWKYRLLYPLVGREEALAHLGLAAPHT